MKALAADVEALVLFFVLEFSLTTSLAETVKNSPP